MKVLACCLIVYLAVVKGEKLSISKYLSKNETQQLSQIIESAIGNLTDLESSKLEDNNDGAPFNVTSMMQTYSEKKCRNQKIENSTVTLNGFIKDNAITYQEKLLRNWLGNIQISSSPGLNGFDVDLGITKFTDGIVFHFNDNQMKCSQQKMQLYNSFQLKICVQATNMKRQYEGREKGCFLVGGALLTSQYYDINTINSYNGMTGLAIDLGCYNASADDITFYPSDNSTSLGTTLGAIITPLHNDICSDATRTLPFIIPLICIILKLIFTL